MGAYQAWQSAQADFKPASGAWRSVIYTPGRAPLPPLFSDIAR
ncbi:hypothetical protein LTSEMON_6278 [Salmonella enterica subsp. enterica serovar Montevideo str. S5-403]|uniref:Uncharacterized protein n=1 Tax=Salmonella enterica subsp. enterica serovar Montevideo str. S5-403 TaxID=913242 RepID=G5QCD5_SALMO|nr:hypothetical protein LTSEMON_6278 [Salmonella enterica subsp. enterica serovar Montevideo str. S5-403]